MSNNLISLQSQSTSEHSIAFTKTIDGKLFTVRAFFPAEGVETMQQKIERMLHRDIMNTAHQTAI